MSIEQHRQQPDHTGRDVRAVESGEREEGRSEQIRPDREPFVHERSELVRLAAEEAVSKQCGHEQPELGVAENLLAKSTLRLSLVLDRRKREHHRQRRHQQNERRCRRDGDVQDRVDRRAQSMDLSTAACGYGPTTLRPL